MGKFIPTFDIGNNYVDEDDSGKGVVAAVYISIFFALHASKEKLSVQLVFG